MFETIPYQRPLVIGTGGGNDIVSAALVAYDLQFAGRKPDLAGICSPGAVHFYAGERERPVNHVTNNVSRIIPAKTPVPIGFIDGMLPALCTQYGLESKIYNLSGRYGTGHLIEAVEELVTQNNYDGIIGVDVGGDILARGEKDPTILSPLMDFTTLYMLQHSTLPATLVELGLQTDGELRPKGCAEIIQELQPITKEIDPFHPAVDFFRKLYDGVSVIRKGHTGEMTLKTFSATDDILETYRFTLQVHQKKWQSWFPITLEAKYFRKAFFIDPKNMERPHAMAYRELLEHCLKSKLIVDTRNEMDILYAWHDNICVWLGLVTPQIDGKMRQEILQHGLCTLPLHADVALLWKGDGKFSHFLCQSSVGDFIVVGDSKKNVEEIQHHVEELLETNS